MTEDLGQDAVDSLDAMVVEPGLAPEVVHTVHVDIKIPPGCQLQAIRFPVRLPNVNKGVLKKVEVLQYHNSVPSTVYCNFSDVPSNGVLLLANVEGNEVICREATDVHYVFLYQPGGYTFSAPSQQSDVVFDNSEKIDRLLQEVDMQYLLLDLTMITTLPISRNGQGVAYFLLVDQPGLQHLTGPLRMYIRDNENCDLFQGAIEDFNGIPGIRADRLESVIGPIVKEIHQKVSFVGAQQTITFVRADGRPFGDVPSDFADYAAGSQVLLSSPQRLVLTVRYHVLPVNTAVAQTNSDPLHLSLPQAIPMAMPQAMSIATPMAMSQVEAVSMPVSLPMAVPMAAQPQRVGVPMTQQQQRAPQPMTLQQRQEQALQNARTMMQQQIQAAYGGRTMAAPQVYMPSTVPQQVVEQPQQTVGKKQVEASHPSEKAPVPRQKVAVAYPA